MSFIYSPSRQEIQMYANRSVPGMLANEVSINKKQARIDPTSTNVLYAGTAVKLVRNEHGTLIVDKAAANDPIYGFVVYEAINAFYTAGKMVGIASSGVHMCLAGDSAIVAGDKVEFVPGSYVLATNSGQFDAVKVWGQSNTIVGLAMSSTNPATGIVIIQISTPFALS